jgi:hypothetical protein
LAPLDLAQTPVLLLAPVGRRLLEHAGVHSCVQLINVHCPNAQLDAVVFCLQPLDRFRVLLGLIYVAGLKAFGDKLESGLANVELAQQLRELPRQNSFRDIGLRTAHFVARAAIVDVATFLDVSGQRATTMAAAHERRERKVILHTAELLPLAAVKRVLNPLEQAIEINGVWRPL